jgi:hypothetical protein
VIPEERLRSNAEQTLKVLHARKALDERLEEAIMQRRAFPWVFALGANGAPLSDGLAFSLRGSEMKRA